MIKLTGNYSLITRGAAIWQSFFQLTGRIIPICVKIKLPGVVPAIVTFLTQGVLGIELINMRGEEKMGMNFTAFLGHKLNKDDIQLLCHALNSRSLKHVEEFITHLLPYNPEDVGKPWKVHNGIGGTMEIIGPCGMDFTFSEKVCYFHHYIRWRSFLLDEEIQLYFRKVTFDLAIYFSATYAIYVPDNGSKESGILDFIWDDENKDIDYIKNWLLERCGTPKTKIIDIYKEYEDYWDSEGYYVDYFSDYK